MSVVSEFVFQYEGESYLDSAKAVYNAAKSRFGTAYVNDSLVEIPLTCGLLIMLVLVFLVCWAVDGWSSNIVIAMMAGWVIYMCVLSTVWSLTFFPNNEWWRTLLFILILFADCQLRSDPACGVVKRSGGDETASPG